LSQPKVFVITSKGSPRTALEKASDNIAKQAEEFGDKFKAASK
jgi:DNA-directed RNA polymerase subunit L